MLKKVICTFFVAVFWVAAYGAAPLSVDPAHSNVSFSLPILGGISKVTGKFGQFSAEVNFDETNISASSVVAKIKTESISTGIAARDAHLRTADFFDAEKFPEITFTSKSVAKKGGKYFLTGDLSMHGVTKELTFPFTIRGNCADKNVKAITGPCGFNAVLQLNRKDFGIAYERKDNADFMGDVVDIELDILTRAPEAAKTK